MADLLNYAYTKNIETHFLTSSTNDLSRFVIHLNFPLKFYNSDPTTLKTIVRSNPGLLLLKKGKIVGKWHYNDIPSIKDFDFLIKEK
jgi:hypothetical protein